MNKAPSKQAVQAWIQLHRCQRHLLDQAEKALSSNNLPPLAWYDVLLELEREKATGLRQFEIGEKVLLNKHNLSRLLDRLEKNKLVERMACEEDGRGNRIRLTAAGEKTLKRVWPVYAAAIEENFSSRLSASELYELERLLRKLIDSG